MKKSFLLLVLSCYASNAFSWGGMGHQTIGEIAERNLSHEARQGVMAILGPEQLALSAIWADSVRDDSDFESFKPFHFISMPLAPNTLSSLNVLNFFPQLIQAPEVNRNVKMTALKYLIHVVGDVHQPFHVGKTSDMGGNFCKVQWSPNQIFNLHETWDGKIIDYDISILKKGSSPLKFYSFVHYANDIVKKHPLNDGEIKNIKSAPIENWISESISYQTMAYPSEKIEEYCSKNSTKLPLITDEYKKQAAELSELRILQAGLRLAELLNQIFKNGVNPGSNEILTKKQILDQVLSHATTGAVF